MTNKETRLYHSEFPNFYIILRTELLPLHFDTINSIASCNRFQLLKSLYKTSFSINKKYYSFLI